MRFVLFFFSLCITASAQTISLTDSDILALGVADGYGKNATGGRGYGVYFVTNLNNTGTGSLRQALSDADAAGGGNIIFRVSGTIEITSHLYIRSNITVWGSSAPGDGITVHGDSAIIENESNIIVENVRFRMGDTAATTDCFSVLSSSSAIVQNIMLDQLSVSWGQDENISFARANGVTGRVENVTFQRSIVSEPFGSKGTLLYWEAHNISIIQNAYLNNYDRNIRSSTGTSEWEFHNNIVYNNYGPHSVAYGSDFDAIGNVFKQGPQGETYGSGLITAGTGQAGETFTIADTDFYASDNIKIGHANPIIESELSPRLQGARLYSGTSTIYSSSVIKDTVWANVGARHRISGLDALDQEMLDDYDAGTGNNNPANEAATSGLPTLASGTAYIDDDNDGIPDSFEDDNGGDLSNTTRYSSLLLDSATKTVDQSGVTSYTSNGLTALEVAMWERRKDWGHFTVTGGGGPTCSDGIQNGDETGIDCGGSCAPCGGGPTGTGNKSAKRKGIIF